MILAIFLFCIGMILLIGGAKFLVSGASQLAATFKISSLVIGLTVVAFGTSSPEIGVSSVAAWQGNGGLVIGNIVGSNIINILLVMGLCATITPLAIQKQLIRWDVPLMIFLSLLFWLLAAQGHLGRWVGIPFLIAICLYIWIAYKIAKREEATESIKIRNPVWLQLIFIGVGLVFLSLGSQIVIKNATYLAHFWGISELFMGLTLVAFGTSLPELATALVAVKKRERDLAVGSLVGSNIFNLLAVTGVAATVAPFDVPAAAIFFDIPVMVAVAIATLPIFLTGHLISRWEGIVFLLYYALYLTYLILDALAHPLLPLFTSAFYFFILPLTLLTLIVGLVRHFRKEK